MVLLATNYKKQIRVVGFDDGPHDRHTRKKVLVVGVVLRGNDYVDGIISTRITRDGADATRKIAEAINRSRHKRQLQVVFLDTIAFGGMNLVDIQELHELTGLKVIAVIRDRPNPEKFVEAIKKLPGAKRRLAINERAGPIHGARIGESTIRFQCAGVSPDDARQILRLSVNHSTIPEALRLAHLIATGIEHGESRKRP